MMMPTRERPFTPRARVEAAPLAEAVEAFPWKKAAAVVVWSLGLFCTQATIGMAIPAPLLSWALAIVVQAALTFAESPIWRRETYDGEPRPYGLINIACVLGDTALNIGGVWPFVAVLHTWPPVVAVGEMFDASVAPLRGGWALAVCAALGFLMAATPEKLWADEG
jgi:hypothetical protein